MTVDTFDALRRFFRRALETEQHFERLRQDNAMREVSTIQNTGMGAIPQWGRRKAFEQIDWLARGYITGSEVMQALESLGDPAVRVDRVDVESLVKRFNKNAVSGKISLKEFIDEVTPKVPSKTY